MPFKLNNRYSIRQIIRSGGFLLLQAAFFCTLSFAQTNPKDEQMPLDERGKYIHYEVVEAKQIPADSLRSRAAAFLKMKKLSAVKITAGQVSANGKFLISKTAFVLTRPSGEATYNFVFEIKEGKYRFWLSDFVFIPYKRDRYANFVPSTNKGTPLENDPGKLSGTEWDSYISATTAQSNLFATSFKEFLASEKKIIVQPKVKASVSTKNW